MQAPAVRIRRRCYTSTNFDCNQPQSSTIAARPVTSKAPARTRRGDCSGPALCELRCLPAVVVFLVAGAGLGVLGASRAGYYAIAADVRRCECR
jgi:hypothetical protein